MAHDALQSLLSRQPQIPRVNPELAEYGPTEEELYDLQEASTTRTPGGYTFTPSRQSVQDSSLAGLRRMFGVAAIEQAAKERALRIPKEYGLEEARIKGSADVEAARQKAKAMAATSQEATARHLQGIEKQQSGAGQRAELSARTRTQTAGAARRMSEQNLARRQAFEQSQDVRRGKVSPPGMGGVWGGVKELFGIGPSRDEAADEIMQKSLGGVDVDIANFVQQAQQQYPGASLDEVLQATGEDQLTPEEYAQAQDLWGQ